MTAKCNLIIDSCSDLPCSMLAREGIDVIHLSYVLNGASIDDDLFESRSPHDFYDSMRNGLHYTTSQISAAEIEEAFLKAIRADMPTVYLAFSSGLSGCYETAMLVLGQLKEKYPDAPIYVVDTLVGSTPEGLLVAEAIRLRDHGMSAEELVAWVEEARFFVQTLFMVDDLEALHRGGRLPASVALVGSKLDVKPLLAFDTEGCLSLVGIARGRKKGVRQMAEFFAKAHDTNSQGSMVGVGNADCPRDADRLAELIERTDENVMVLKSNVGPTIGSHVGPGMVSLSFWGSDRRESLSVADRIARKVKTA